MLISPIIFLILSLSLSLSLTHTLSLFLYLNSFLSQTLSFLPIFLLPLFHSHCFTQFSQSSLSLSLSLNFFQFSPHSLFLSVFFLILSYDNLLTLYFWYLSYRSLFISLLLIFHLLGILQRSFSLFWHGIRLFLFLSFQLWTSGKCPFLLRLV